MTDCWIFQVSLGADGYDDHAGDYGHQHEHGCDYECLGGDALQAVYTTSLQASDSTEMPSVAPASQARITPISWHHEQPQPNGAGSAE